MTTFTPPVGDGQAWGKTDDLYNDRLFRYYGAVPTGVTVWQDQADVWHEQQYPYAGLPESPGLDQAKHVYLGGHVHDISQAEALSLIFAGYGDRINLEPVKGIWTTEQLAKFESKYLMTADGSHATGPPFISENKNLKIQLNAGTTQGQSQLREFFLNSDTAGWTDTHGICRIDPPTYAADVDGDPALDIIPQMGVCLRAQFNSGLNKNHGITLNNGTFLALPILNIGVWQANVDGTGFSNRQLSWPLFDSYPLPYGFEYILTGVTVQVRIFPANERPDYTSWTDPIHAKIVNLDTDAGSTVGFPTPILPGTNGIISAHLGRDSRSATRIRGDFLMERLL